MAFPQSPLPLHVRIAPGAQVTGDPSDWQWVEVTGDVRVDPGVTIEAGRSDEAQRVNPGKATLVFDNRSGNYATRNPLGAWYGQIGLNTPIRVSTTMLLDTFSRTAGPGWGSTDLGQVWATSTPSAWSVSGGQGSHQWTSAGAVRIAAVSAATAADVDVAVTFSVPAVLTGASLVAAIAVRVTDSNTHYSMSCEFDTGGAITTKIRRHQAGVGVTTLAALAGVPGLTYAAGTQVRVRAQADGAALRVKIWLASGSEPPAWTLTTSDTVLQGPGSVGLYLWLVSGATPAFPFALSVDNMEAEAVEFAGYVPEWTPRWDQSGRDARTPIAAAGILRRLLQGKSPLKSALTRQYGRYAPVGHWPGEDASGTTVMAATTPRARPATARAATFGEASTLPGAASTIKISTSTVLAGRVPTHASTGTWMAVWFADLLAPPAALTPIMTITSTGTSRTLIVELDAVGPAVRGEAADGTQTFYNGIAWPAGIAPPGWTAYVLLVRQSGANVTYELHLYKIGDDITFNSGTQTIAGTAGAPATWRTEGSLGYNDGKFSQLAFFNYEAPVISLDFMKAANGYRGELAADRITRLCAEENVPVLVEPGHSEPLGPQKVATFLELLYAAEDADLGILYERSFGLAYRPRGARYNRGIDAALDRLAGHLSEPPEPADDDQAAKNQWTVDRDGGSSAVASDPDSIAVSGLLDDSATVNVATDTVLPDHASWRLHLSTPQSYRWPRLDIDLAARPALMPLWRRLPLFGRFTLANPPVQAQGAVIDQILEGYTATLSAYEWKIAATCSPASGWDVGVYSAAARYDSRTTTLASGAAAGVTTLALSTAVLADVWSTTAAGYDLLIAGERVTVTAMTAPAGNSPWTQSATVVRGVGGLTKALPAGSPVHLATPARYAL